MQRLLKIFKYIRASQFIRSDDTDGITTFYVEGSEREREIAIRKTLPFKLIEIDTGGVEFEPYEFPEGCIP
ncbi:hypothetical protein CEN49_27760 [Fischerella thermalis CCMEE 5273]|nr:hypothetical protein CEN49_27760 [Fischerella thermalis CCMEE 5273]